MCQKDDLYYKSLREKAESLVAMQEKNTAPFDQSEIARVFHELTVHQIELEMQNEQLRMAQSEL